MGIRGDGALFYCRLHVSDDKQGFHPYIICVKNGGTYIEGENGHLLHISLHHGINQKDNSLSQCHLTIPSETNSRVIKHGFDNKQLFKWNRKRGEKR